MLLITPAAQLALIKKLGLENRAINEELLLLNINKITTQKRFRIRVLGGGCSGFQYKFSIDNSISDGDNILGDGLQLEIVVDQHSLPLILNSTLDHHSSLGSEYFFISNPNAKSKCGCGNSFSV
jgi:iron-sulfur cluster insertion protein